MLKPYKICLLVLFPFCIVSVQATNIEWVGDGFWSDPINWADSVLPDNGDVVIISNGNACSLDYDVSDDIYGVIRVASGSSFSLINSVCCVTERLEIQDGLFLFNSGLINVAGQAVIGLGNESTVTANIDGGTINIDGDLYLTKGVEYSHVGETHLNITGGNLNVGVSLGSIFVGDNTNSSNKVKVVQSGGNVQIINNGLDSGRLVLAQNYYDYACYSILDGILNAEGGIYVNGDKLNENIFEVVGSQSSINTSFLSLIGSYAKLISTVDESGLTTINVAGSAELDGRVVLRLENEVQPGLYKLIEADQITYGDNFKYEFENAQGYEIELICTNTNIKAFVLYDKCLGLQELKQIDPLQRVYPDVDTDSVDSNYVSYVPKGGWSDLAFSFRLEDPSECVITLDDIVSTTGNILDCAQYIYYAKPVYVEANSNGCLQTQIGVVPPESWLPYVERIAPYYVSEALVPTETIFSRSSINNEIIVSLKISDYAKPGIYFGQVNIEFGENQVLSKSFKIHIANVMLGDYELSNSHWFVSKPENLTDKNIPKTFSQEHWDLIRSSLETLRLYGSDTIYIPLDELTWPTGGVYNYEMFNKFVDIAKSVGFERFEGGHTYAINNVSFLQGLYRAINQKNIAGKYMQHINDEASVDELNDYITLHDLLASYLPGIKVIDANWNGEFSDYIDILATYGTVIVDNEDGFIGQRRDDNEEIWYYSCCGPYPPYPNRWLDSLFTSSRLYPWLGFLFNADGYLNWAANRYRGVNPYSSSIGPLPDSSQSPGHPVGDAWFFYPSENGLIGSMRMLAFRQGLQDYSLLKKLQQVSALTADEIMAEIAVRTHELPYATNHGGTTDYTKKSIDLNNSMKDILYWLDAINIPDIDNSRLVDFDDLVVLASQWLLEGVSKADMNYDDSVNMLDLSIFIDSYGECDCFK